VDAVVLACAGMNRLGFSDRYTHAFTPEECLPAVGQGALAIEIKADDRGTRELLAKTADAETTLCVAAERGVMVAVEGSCQVPVAGYAVRAGDRIWLRAMLAKPDGSALSFRELQDTWPNGPEQAFQLGKTLGAELKKEVDGGF
jgi:hydroxymethylbilane synthase